MKYSKIYLMIIAMSYCSTQCMNQFEKALWSPDGTILVSIKNNELILYNGQTKQPIAKTTMKNIHDVIFSPDGTRLAFKAFGSSMQPTVLYLCDGHTGRCINDIPTPFTAKIMFTPDSKIISIEGKSKLPTQNLPLCHYNAINGNPIKTPIETPSLEKNISEFIGNNVFCIENNILYVYDENLLVATMKLTDDQKVALFALSQPKV